MAENIDRGVFFSYNRSMGKNATSKKEYWLWALRVFLTLACLALIGFIFANSLKDSEKSVEQSSGVVKTVQKVAAFFDPNSKIANATGDAYDKLHAVVRVLAHFAEFMLLGGLLCWCVFSYNTKKIFQIVPPAALLFVSLTDECLQIFIEGRAFQLTDVLFDCSGGIVGIGIAILTVWLGFVIYKKRKIEKERALLDAECAADRVGEEE